MVRALLAKLVVKSLVEGAHAAVDARVELGRDEQQLHFGLPVLGQSGPRQQCGGVDRLGGAASRSGGGCAAGAGNGAVDRGWSIRAARAARAREIRIRS